MRNLLCVIGRHEWRMKYDSEGGPTRSVDDQGVITFEVTTPRTGPTLEPIQHRGPLNQTSMRVRRPLPEGASRALAPGSG